MTDMTGPRPEAMHAAAWWASQLGNADHDIGDRDPAERDRTTMANLATALAGRTFTGEQRDAFRRELAMGIEERLRHHETGIWEGAWRPDDPQRGSALRAFGCDYGPDALIADAAQRAGFTIKGIDLPMKTVMWVNPGEVKVSAGYSAPIEVVWHA